MVKIEKNNYKEDTNKLPGILKNHNNSLFDINIEKEDPQVIEKIKKIRDKQKMPPEKYGSLEKKQENNKNIKRDDSEINNHKTDTNKLKGILKNPSHIPDPNNYIPDITIEKEDPKVVKIIEKIRAKQRMPIKKHGSLEKKQMKNNKNINFW